MKRIKEMYKESTKVELNQMLIILGLGWFAVPVVWWSPLPILIIYLTLWYYEKPMNKWMYNE